MHYSPLRYPGGKSKISNFVEYLILHNGLKDCTYIEPYAGGAGVALSLLIKGVVEKIIINDLSKAIYSFWFAIINNTEEICKLIHDTPINIDQWRIQKAIFVENCISLELAFSTLYLNRTNKSGILNGGIIGGYNQNGNWKIDARFNKPDLIKRIERIAQLKNKISIYNLDCLELINRVITKSYNDTFIYFDPPYTTKGKRLYENFYNLNDHKVLADEIKNKVNMPWLLTYDSADEIRKYYSGYSIKEYHLNYSAVKRQIGSELMICSKNIKFPSPQELKEEKIVLYE